MDYMEQGIRLEELIADTKRPLVVTITISRPPEDNRWSISERSV